VRQMLSGVEGSPAEFYVSPWRLPVPQLPGWELVSDKPPLVRVYASGYRRLPDMKWKESGATLRLQKLPDTKEALLKELDAWRHDIDAELAANRDRDETLAGQQKLLRMLNNQCNSIASDVRKGICFEPGSEIARHVEEAGRIPSSTQETPEGSQNIRVIAKPAPKSQSGMGSTSIPMLQPPATGGFSIEPDKPEKGAATHQPNQ
jgi:hypothetical protein